MPPRPSKHVLATPAHRCPDGDATTCSLHGQHAAVTATFELSTCQQRRMEYKQQSHIPPWDIDASVFAQRKKDSCAFFDTGCAILHNPQLTHYPHGLRNGSEARIGRWR